MLNSKQRQYLKGLAHSLKPVILVGKNGIDSAVISALDNALTSHELIKVKLLESCNIHKKEAAIKLAEVSGAEMVNLIGRTIILYRPHLEKPKISLP